MTTNVQFTDKSTASAGVSSRLWEFGDGQTSGLQDPDHDYEPGSYAARLTITSTTGRVRSVEHTVHIEPPYDVTYDFTEDTHGFAPTVSQSGDPVPFAEYEPGLGFHAVEFLMSWGTRKRGAGITGMIPYVPPGYASFKLTFYAEYTRGLLDDYGAGSALGDGYSLGVRQGRVEYMPLSASAYSLWCYFEAAALAYPIRAYLGSYAVKPPPYHPLGVAYRGDVYITGLRVQGIS